MAPGSAGLALKAAALVSVLALLAVPSSGRCGHSPKPPPPPPPPSPPPPAAPTPPPPAPPTPAPAPGPGATISCKDCYSQCNTSCQASVRSACSNPCDSIADRCDSCFATEIQKCKESTNCTGSCDECNDAPNSQCAFSCTTRHCDECILGSGQYCPETCTKKCSAPNCIP